MDKQKLIEKCKENGVDKVGIASIERFKNVEPSGDPRFILPSVKSVIVLLHSIPRGWIRGVESRGDWEVVFKRGGFIDSSIILEIGYNICTYIEDEQFDAVPLYHYPVEMRGQGVQVREGRPEPDVVMDTLYAAHAAGLGQFGDNGLFLTPEYGPRQQFSIILTNAELEEDPIPEKGVCDHCRKCIKACPAKAVSETEFVTVHQTNGDIKIHKITSAYCKTCKSGAVPNSFWSSADPERLLAACGRSCIAHLEDEGLLEYKFENKFRRK